MKRNVYFLLSLLFAISIPVLGIYLHSYLEDKLEYEEVPCYDKYNNVIEGVTCQETFKYEKILNALVLIIFLLGVLNISDFILNPIDGVI